MAHPRLSGDSPRRSPSRGAGAARPVGARCGSHLSSILRANPSARRSPGHAGTFFTGCIFYTSAPADSAGIVSSALPARSLAASIRPPLHTQRLENAGEIPLGTPEIRDKQDLFLPAAGLASGLHLTARRHGTCEHKARAGDEQFCAVAETYGGSATEDPPFGGLWCDQPALFLFG